MEVIREQEAAAEGEGRRVEQVSVQGCDAVPRYLTAQGVAERKRRSREQLEKSGGHLMREVRLDREANEAFLALRKRHPGLDAGAIVRLALVASARAA